MSDALSTYKNKQWLYAHYVTKRMNLKDIVELLDQKYQTKVTIQTLYNWCEKYDLLKFRGKGRKMGMKNDIARAKRPKSEAQKRVEQIRLEQNRRRRAMKRGR